MGNRKWPSGGRYGKVWETIFSFEETKKAKYYSDRFIHQKAGLLHRPALRLTVKRILTLGVLVPGAGSAQAVLFAFFGAGVASQEPGALQYAAQINVKGK